LDFRGLWNPKAPSVVSLGALSKEIKKLPRGEVVRLGGMTDCFQPIEKKYHTTLETIKILNKYGIGYLIVTKSAMVADYMNILDKNLAHIQVTVTTLDDDLAATYEKASKPTDRVKAIQALQGNGYDVQLRLSPFIPQYVDFDRLNTLGIDKILIEFLRVNTWVKKWFDIDYSEYTVK
jgi:DNA repair photolyase